MERFLSPIFISTPMFQVRVLILLPSCTGAFDVHEGLLLDLHVMQLLCLTPRYVHTFPEPIGHITLDLTNIRLSGVRLAGGALKVWRNFKDSKKIHLHVHDYVVMLMITSACSHSVHLECMCLKVLVVSKTFRDNLRAILTPKTFVY